MADNVFDCSHSDDVIHQPGEVVESQLPDNELFRAVHGKVWITCDNFGLVGTQLGKILDKVSKNPHDPTVRKETASIMEAYWATKESIKYNEPKALNGDTLDTKSWTNKQAAAAVNKSAKTPLTGTQASVIKFVSEHEATKRKAEAYVRHNGVPKSGNDYQNFVNMVCAENGMVDNFTNSELAMRVSYGINKSTFYRLVGTDKAKRGELIKTNITQAKGKPDEFGFPTMKYKTFELVDIEEGVRRAFESPTPRAAETPVAAAPPPRPIDDTTPQAKNHGKRNLNEAFEAEDGSA